MILFQVLFIYYLYPGRKVRGTWDLEKLIYLLKVLKQVDLLKSKVDFFHVFLPYQGDNLYFLSKDTIYLDSPLSYLITALLQQSSPTLVI